MTQTRTQTRRPSQNRRVPVVAIALGAIALVAIIGIAISVGGEAERQDDAPAFGPVVVEGAALGGEVGYGDAAGGGVVEEPGVGFPEGGGGRGRLAVRAGRR